MTGQSFQRIWVGSFRSSPSRSRSFSGQGEAERPVGILFDCLDKLIGDQQGQVKLAQAAVLPLDLDKLEHIRMGDVEGRHLRAAPATGRSNSAAHAVVDVHERQRPRGIGRGAVDKSVAWPQSREIITDTAASLEGQAGFVHLGQDFVH